MFRSIVVSSNSGIFGCTVKSQIEKSFANPLIYFNLPTQQCQHLGNE